MKDVKQSQRRIYKHAKSAPLFPTLAYEPEEQLFLMEDQHIGFGFHVSPLNGADESTISNLNVLLTAEVPPNTYIQYSLFGSPNIEQLLGSIGGIRDPFIRGTYSDDALGTSPETRKLLSTMISERQKFLRSGITTPLEDRFHTRVRDNIGWVCYKIPYDG